jgi:hypothetical protein
MLTIVIGSLLFQKSIVSSYFISIPIFLTIISFSFFVHRRRNTGKEYHLKRGNFEYRVMVGLVSISCFFVVLFGVRDVISENLLVRFTWISLGFIAGIWGLIEIRRKY